MSFTVIIPARFESTRLPGKPLVDILGRSMIQRVYDQASKSDCHRVIVATDSIKVFDEVKKFGGEVTMTATTHVSGTDRIQEVAKLEDLADNEIIVNVQGDEPLIPPSAINQVAECLSLHNCFMGTLYEKIDSFDELFDPNIVKLVSDNYGRALYFSRAPIPWDRDVFAEEKRSLDPLIEYKRHIGIYAYRVDALNQFVQWPMASIENTEKLEQLRIMAEGKEIFVEEVAETFPPGIDTAADLQRTIDYLES